MANNNGTPYADEYRKKYEEYWKTHEKPSLKKYKPLPQTPSRPSSNEPTSSFTKEVKEIEKKIEFDIKKLEKEITTPKHIRFIKAVVILAVLALAWYLVFSNFLASRDFVYQYDIGSATDAKKPYLTPSYRITGVLNDSLEDYREMTSGLVYFTVNIPRGAETIYIQAKFKDTFPKNSKMSIGAKDQDVWHYKYNLIYDNTKNQSTKNKWIVGETSFNLNEDKLVVKNNQLSLLFNMPHFSKLENANYTIPIDWITIKVHKPGLFEKWGWM